MTYREQIRNLPDSSSLPIDLDILFATLECELLDRTRFPDPEVARREIFDFIEGRYDTRRRHSSIGYQSPLGFERQLRGRR